MAAHVGRETKLVVDAGTPDEKTWILSRLERRQWVAFLTWAKTVLPDPREIACDLIEKLALRAIKIGQRSDLSADEKKALLDANLTQQKHAAEYAIDAASSYLQVDSKAVQSLFSSFEGASKMLELCLQDHQPGTTHDQAYELMTKVGLESMQKKLDEAGGVSPPKEPAPTAA